MMEPLQRCQYNYLMFTVTLGLTAWTQYGVDGACSSSERKLWAYANPSTEYFTDTYKKYISSDRGERCRWVITSSDRSTSNVKLTFSYFQLKFSTESDKGDCVEIYDGEDDDKKLDELCDKIPLGSYTSTDGKILVIYRRGEVEGDRQFNMTYSLVSVMTKEKIIQIAGISGAVLAGVGLTYFVFKVTKCCKCLRKKDNIDNNFNSNTTRERDRLVQNLEQGGENTQHNQNSTTNQPRIPLSSNGAASSSVIQDGITTNDSGIAVNDNAHGSDTDSLPDFNEPPPSYETLYLNEMGESVAPPKYSPPQHRSTHPPRRVNTLN